MAGGPDKEPGFQGFCDCHFICYRHDCEVIQSCILRGHAGDCFCIHVENITSTASRPCSHNAARAVLLLVWGWAALFSPALHSFHRRSGYIPVDWAVPKAAVLADANLTYSWARQPGADPGSVLGNRDWLRPSFLRMSHQIINIVYPFGVFMAFCAIIIILGTLFCIRKRPMPPLLEYLVFIPPLLGLPYWFFTAPDPAFRDMQFSGCFPFAHPSFYFLYSIGQFPGITIKLHLLLSSPPPISPLSLTFPRIITH